jgi:hypothetical protein
LSYELVMVKDSEAKKSDATSKWHDFALVRMQFKL